MHSFRFYKSRADLALALADKAENFNLRDQYLQLAKEWSTKAHTARDTPGSAADREAKGGAEIVGSRPPGPS